MGLHAALKECNIAKSLVERPPDLEPEVSDFSLLATVHRSRRGESLHSSRHFGTYRALR